MLVSRDFGANDSWLVFIFAGSFWPFAFKIFGLYLEAFKFLTAIFLHLLKEKAPYEAKAAKKKADYEKLMNAYNKKQVNHLYYFDSKKFFCWHLLAIKHLYLCMVIRRAWMTMVMRNQRGPNPK